MRKMNFLWTLLFMGILSLAQTPTITMIADGDCTGGQPKVVEIYANGRVDFSNYTLQKSANGASFGYNLSLADLGTVTDDFVYIIRNSNGFFATEFPSAINVLDTDNSAVNFNGDDAIRLIDSEGNIIDQYGTEVDGSGEVWEYKDGYAKRNDNTTPNGSYVEGDWTYANGGLNGGGTCQDGPTFESMMGGIGTYSPSATTNDNEVANIAALRAGNIGEEYTLTGEAIITMQQAYRNQKWIEDGSAAILIDDNAGVINTSYNLYDGITGITGTLSEYNGVLQFIPVADPGATSSTDNIVTPQLVSVAEYTANPEAYESELLEFNNVMTNVTGVWETGTNYSFNDENYNELTVRTNYYDANYIGEMIPSESINLVAIAGEYNGNAQVYPRFSDDIQVVEVPCEAPSNLAIENITSSGFTASWDASTGVVGYNLYVVLEGNDSDSVDGIFTTDTTYDVTNLNANTNYDVMIESVCEGGNTSSDQITTTVTTLEEELVEVCVEGAVTIAVEDFDNSTWSNNIDEYLFVDPTDSEEGLFIQTTTGNNPNFSGNSLYGHDLGGETGEPTASPYEFVFDSVDISDYENVKVSFDYYAFANSDTGSYIVVIDGEASEAVEFYNDPDTDPIFGTVVVDIPEGSSSVALILQGSLNGGSDILELDNFKVCGVEMISECTAPSNVVLTRLSDTTAEFTSADDMDAHYQGSANRAGRPLRPRPLYGMTDITVGHIQYNLIPQFDYDLWFRTVCDDGSYTEWVGPFYLPMYEEAGKPSISLYPNPTKDVVKLDMVEAQSVEVYNMKGILLMKSKPSNNKLDLSTLPIGKYNLRIVDTNGKVYFEPIMKK